MRFEILGEISEIETFALGSRIREVGRLRRTYGRGRWRKRKGLARVRLEDGSMAKQQSKQLVVCIDNEGYAASLERRKIYVALRDPAAEKHGLVRIIDESGDDYLYPKKFFRSIALPQAIRKAVLAA